VRPTAAGRLWLVVLPLTAAAPADLMQRYLRKSGHVWTAPGWQELLHGCSSGRSSHVFGLLVRGSRDRWP
jgi:hypothetical protein